MPACLMTWAHFLVSASKYALNSCEVLATTDGQTLVILAPPPGPSALEKLRLLALVGDQTGVASWVG